jgi:uncharacterized protein (DUF1330 family)
MAQWTSDYLSWRCPKRRRTGVSVLDIRSADAAGRRTTLQRASRGAGANGPRVCVSTALRARILSSSSSNRKLHRQRRAVSDRRPEGVIRPTEEEWAMNTTFKIAIAVVAGAALGAAAVQGLHAQAKPKAYLVTEIEVLDAAAADAYGALIRPVQGAAGARVFRTAGGKIVSLEGAAPPKRVAIAEWDSMDQVQAYYDSAARKNLLPQRDKAEKITRAYAVEVVN